MKARSCFVQTLDEILKQTKVRLEQFWILLFFRTTLLRPLPRSNFLFQNLLRKAPRFVTERTIRVVHIDNLIFFSIDPFHAPPCLLQTLAFDLRRNFFDRLFAVFAYPLLYSFFTHVDVSLFEALVNVFVSCICVKVIVLLDGENTGRGPRVYMVEESLWRRAVRTVREQLHVSCLSVHKLWRCDNSVTGLVRFDGDFLKVPFRCKPMT